MLQNDSSPNFGKLSPDQFARDVLYAYEALIAVPLQRDYLLQLVEAFKVTYAKFFPRSDDPATTYEQFLNSAIRGLVDFTRAVDTPALEQPAGRNFLLYTLRRFLEFIPTYKPLAAPWKDLDHLANGLEFFPPVFPEVFKPDEPADNADKETLKRYQRRMEEYERAYDKARKQSFEDLLPEELSFCGTPLWPFCGRLIPFQDVKVPFEIKPDKWFEGCWIIAPPGRGKTNLLRHLALHHLNESCSVIIMDAKGELIDSFNRLHSLKDRLVFLEPDLDHPLAINPLDIGAHSVELLEYIFAALLESQMTPLQSTLFRAILVLLSTVPGATLETFRQLLNVQKNDELAPWAPYIEKLYPEDQEFFYKEMNSKTYVSTKQEVLWRLRLLNGNPYMRAIFRSPTTRVDIGALMDAGKVICINNNYDTLGDQGSEFFARFFIALVWNAARKRSRSREHKTPVYFFIDEAHYAIARDRMISTILNQCRAQKISMIFAHQELQQIKDDDVKTALSNCAIKFANSTGEAYELASRLDTTPEFLKSQKRGQFAVCVRDLTDTAVSIPIPLIDMSAYATMSEAEFQSIQRQGYARYCGGEDAPRSRERPREEPQAEEPPKPEESEKPEVSPDLRWTITISPKIAEKGGQHRLQVKNNAHQSIILNITIPPGTEDGDVLRVKGYGAFNGAGERGHLYLTIRVPAKPVSGKDQSRPGNLGLGTFKPDDEERW